MLLFSLNVSEKSKFGNWSYKVQDTKLSQHTKAVTILQSSLYTDILTGLLVHPWSFNKNINPVYGSSCAGVNHLSSDAQTLTVRANSPHHQQCPY